MNKILDEKDVQLLRLTQEGIPLVHEPYHSLAQSLGISENEVISRLKRLNEKRVIRRFTVSINNRKTGINANGMVVWKVPESRIEEVGKTFANEDQVSHCYVRTTVPGKWDYNLYTVLHSRNKVSVENMAKKMSEKVKIEDFRILFSTRELKKTSNGRIIDQVISKILIGEKKN
jgi:DNA-binding Lrp family transcriptional regulator